MNNNKNINSTTRKIKDQSSHFQASEERRYTIEKSAFGIFLKTCSLLLMLFLFSELLYASNEQEIYFNIDKQRADLALIELAEQADITMVFSFDDTSAVTTNRVRGNKTVAQALVELLANTGLTSSEKKHGIFQVSINSEMGKIMNKKTLFTQIGMFLSGASVAATAIAVEEEPNNYGLEEVIVTAQKRAQSANDIGMSIASIDADTIKSMGINDTTILAEAVPGLTFSDTGFSTPVYTLRGVGFSENSVQAQSTVGVYNDQVAVPYPIMTKGLLMDIERLEVLKGPQGTLFGRNSTGGAINYIANKPTEELEASATFGYSRFDTKDIETVLSGSFSDKVGARFAYRTLQSGEGWQESISRNDTHGEQDKQAARLLMDIEASDNLNILLSANWWQDKSDTQIPQVIELAPRVPANTVITGFQDDARVSLLGTNDNQATDWAGGNTLLRGGPKADMSSSALSMNIDWDINDEVTLTSLTSFSDFENFSSYAADANAGTPFDASINGVTLSETINPLALPLYDGIDIANGAWYVNDSTIEAFSQELRLSGQQDNINWVAGAYVSSDSIESNLIYYSETNSSTNTFHLNGRGLEVMNNPTQQDAETWAIFGHTEWDFAESLKLTAGLRYTEETKDFEGCTGDSGLGDTASFFNAIFGTNYQPGECTIFVNGAPGGVAKKELNEDSLSGKLALDWRVNDDILAYASFSRGFKGGSFPTLVTSSDEQYEPAIQERLDAYEIGVKATALDNTLQFNAATFYYDYKDKQLLSKVLTIFGPSNALDNAPESKALGAEFDLQWVPSEGLYVSLGANYTKTEATEFIAFNQRGVQGDMSGSSFPLSPELQATAMINYEWAVNDNLMAYLGADLSYSDEFKTDYDISSVQDVNGRGYPELLTSLGIAVGDSYAAEEVFQVDSTTLLGAQLGVRSVDDRWNLTFWGRNLTDEYRVSNQRLSSDEIIAFTGMPTTYGVTFNYNWY